MLREGERLAYLQALGITQYVPRQPIADALLLPEVEAEVEPEPEIQLAPAAPPVEPVRPPVAPPEIPPEPLADVPLLDVSKLKPPSEISRAAIPAAPALRRFAMGVITLPGQARMLVELAQPDAPGLSAFEYRLLSDLLLALGIRQPLSDSMLTYRWPFVRHQRVDDLQAAREGLLAFLASAQSDQPQPRLLFLGAAVLPCFTGQQAGTAFSLVELDNLPVLVAHSLASLQRDWTLKPQLWQQLQAFLA